MKSKLTNKEKLKRLKSDLKLTDVNDNILDKLIMKSSKKVQDIIYVRYWSSNDVLTYKIVDEKLSYLEYKNTCSTIREWKLRLNEIINRIKIAESNSDDVANLDIDMNIYESIDFCSKRYGRTRSISDINNMSDYELLRSYCNIGGKKAEVIRKSIKDYYNNVSRFSIDIIKTV